MKIVLDFFPILLFFGAFKFADMVIGLRVPADEEREGLDITTHGESAYHA